MNTIIALGGKKVFLFFAGFSIVASAVYIGVRGRESAIISADKPKENVSEVQDSSYINTQWNDAVGGTKGMPQNWPKDAPVAYKGATLMSSLTKNLGTGKMDPSVVYFIDIPIDVVIEYYVHSLRTNGWNIEANADSAGYRVITAKKDTRSFFAFISSDPKVKTGVTSGVSF